MSTPPTNSVRQLRETVGQSQAELAAEIGISRSGLSAIESGRLVPSVATALALAQALHTSVEALFAPAKSESWAWAFPPTRKQRYWAAVVGSRRLLFPAESVAPSATWHDGNSAEGELTAPVGDQAERTLVVACCDPASHLLAMEYQQRSPFRMLVLRRSSRQALRCLAEGLVHVAGVHFSHGRQTGGNRTAAMSELDEEFQLVHVARWEEGLAVRPALKANRVSDLLGKRSVWVGREQGSSARQCQDELLEGRLTPRREALDHHGVVNAIRCGWADVGLSVRLPAEEAGLNFMVVRREDYEFCIPQSQQADPRVKALLETLRSESFRRHFGELPGYSTKHTGDEA